jgi:hypothetical protein
MKRSTCSSLVKRNRSGRSAAWLARLVRDQEVDGSNPFAPTTPKSLPYMALGNSYNLHCSCVLWTNMYQLKAQPGAFRPLLTKRNVVFEF